MAGGSVVFDVGDGEDAERTAVMAGLKRAFPEYTARPLPADHPLFSTPDTIEHPPGTLAIGNGFRDFVFIPAESWSCHFEVYDIKDHEASFQFMNNLLTYCRDGVPPATRLRRVVVPGLGGPVEIDDRVDARDGQRNARIPGPERHHRPADALELPHQRRRLGVRIAGRRRLGKRYRRCAPTTAVQKSILDALRAGKFVIAELVSGNEDWDETFRAAPAGDGP